MKKIGDRVQYKDSKIYTIIDVARGQDPALYFLKDEQKDIIISSEQDIQLVE